MFCPMCSGELRVISGPVTTPDESYLDTFLACVQCSMVSQVDGNGVLIDMNGVVVADLQEPFIIDDERTPRARGLASLHGRRDS